jgi:hypothetical protein
MEKLSKVSEFGMADNVEAEVVRSGKVLRNETVVDSMSDSMGAIDSVECEVT